MSVFFSSFQPAAAAKLSNFCLNKVQLVFPSNTKVMSNIGGLAGLNKAPCYVYPASNPTAMQNIKIDWKGVHKLLKNLKVHKATGPDEIPAYILKTAADELAPVLALLFQLSMDQGEIPQDLKQALVVLIFKKGDKHQPSNYRPVSLTSITCKLLEHIININIMHHFDQHRVLCDNQQGFRKKRSCETQLLSTIQEIASSTAKGHQVDIILLDFAKPFDKVPNTRLLQKLDHYGVRRNVKRWIESFLSHREQRVILDGVRSESAEVLSGVSQGTVLGPLFSCASSMTCQSL